MDRNDFFVLCMVCFCRSPGPLVSNAAAHFNVSDRTVKSWIHLGSMPPQSVRDELVRLADVRLDDIVDIVERYLPDETVLTEANK